MKLLLVADLHYTLPQWDWLDATAERFDIVVIAGDLLELNSIVPREAQIVVLRKYLQRIAKKVPLLVCSGNHDTLDSPQGKTAQWLQDKHDAKYWTDGEHYTADNLFFSILPWWESETDQIATERQLERDASQAMGKRWIWVYHPPPKGVQLPGTANRITATRYSANGSSASSQSWFWAGISTTHPTWPTALGST